MKYVSTRGHDSAAGFDDILLAGLASDGGLYVPTQWPTLSLDEIGALAGRPYAEVAYRLMRPFIAGVIDDDDLRAICDEAYATFDHRAVVPLSQVGPDLWLLELFHGPTFAFKDVAMQLLARLMDHVLARRGKRVTIVGATSGDTGAAAIEAFRGREAADVFILFPEGRVSPMQQRQMTTVDDANVHAIAVQGTFDDCQSIVKQMFAHASFRDRVGLAGVNSINWARILGQIPYYFTSAVALGAPHRAVSFTVPTGNFGDIYAGYAAKRMGLPIDRLVIATNQNDILARTLALGRYEVTGVTATASPSMDIQVSSNFERLLYSAFGRDAEQVRRKMQGLGQSGTFTIEPQALDAIRKDFDAGSTSEDATLATIREMAETAAMVVDPHTAVGLRVAVERARPGTPMIALSTAHAAKFADAVTAATGQAPALPERLATLASREERFQTLPNDPQMVKDFVLAHSRATRAEASA